ncbi:MAG: sporulation protein YqfD [Lachnospiraceae bacterium]|nr:sporulation protein YqfD [Lachnospiraceae bacterium]
MLLKLLRYLFGFVRVEVCGFAPERLMNLLIKDEIVIWDIAETEHGYSFYIGRKNLLNIKPYLQKTNMKLKVVSRIGLPYFFKRNRRRATFGIGCLIFVALIYTLSLFVWEVKVTGEDHIVAEEMIKHIEKNYIPLGTLKSDIDCSKLEADLRKDFEDISWISCELKGTGLTIHLEEGMQPKTIEDNNIVGDVIAVKNASITKMITRQGTPVAKVNDKVKKGDILISGTIYIYDDNNEVMETNYIAADGDVYGKTSYKYNDYVDLNYYEKEYIDEPVKHITLFFMDYCLTPYMPGISSEKYDTYTQLHKLRIFENFYLPVGYKVITRKPYKLTNMTRDEQTAADILNDRLDKKISEFQENGLEIVKNGVTIEKAGDRVEAKGKIVVVEPIGKLVKHN